MNRELLKSKLQRAMDGDEKLAVVVSVEDEHDGIKVDLCVQGFGPTAFILFAAESLMRAARQQLSIEHRCRLDYLRKQMLLIIEEDDDIAVIGSEQTTRATALN